MITLTREEMWRLNEKGRVYLFLETGGRTIWSWNTDAVPVRQIGSLSDAFDADLDDFVEEYTWHVPDAR